MVLGMLVPGLHKVVFAVTLNAPETNEFEMLSSIVALFWPLVIVVPVGVVQK